MTKQTLCEICQKHSVTKVIGGIEACAMCTTEQEWDTQPLEQERYSTVRLGQLDGYDGILILESVIEKIRAFEVDQIYPASRYRAFDTVNQALAQLIREQC